MNTIKNISNSDKELLINGNCVIRSKLIVLPETDTEELINYISDDTEPAVEQIILTEQNSLKTWTHTEERYVPNEGFIGQFVARTLSGELQNITDDFNITDKTVELQIGIQSDINDDTTASWYTLGEFKISKPSDDEVKDNTKYEAMDKTILFNKSFNANFVNGTFTTSFADTISAGNSFTALQLANYVCAQVGVEFGSLTFENDDFEITSNQFTEGNSCRDVMKDIAKLAYGWVEVDMDNKCYITQVDLSNENAEILTNNNYYSLKVQKTPYGPVNAVYTGAYKIEGEGYLDDDEQSIATGKETRINVYDNNITNTMELRRKASLNKRTSKDDPTISGAKILFGLQYTPIDSMETTGHPWLCSNKLIEIVNMEGVSYYTYPFTNVLKYTGHIKSEISSEGTNTTEDTYGYKEDVYKELKKVFIKVDKQEGTITALNSRTTALESGVGALEEVVKQTITPTYSKTEVQEILKGQSGLLDEEGNPVEPSYVRTTSATVDKYGLTTERSDALTKVRVGYDEDNNGNVDKEGLLVEDDSGNELLFSGYDHSLQKTIVRTGDMHVRHYLQIGTYSRIEDYEDGTGIFIL